MKLLSILALVFLVSACGGGGSGGDVSREPPPSFSIGGTVDVDQAGLILELSYGSGESQSVTLGANPGTFEFPDPITDGLSYQVSVQPSSRPNLTDCQVTAGDGVVAGADVDNIDITCAVTVADPTLSLESPKTFRFTWTDATGAGVAYYRLLENPDGNSGFSPVSGGQASDGVEELEIEVFLPERLNAEYVLQTCDTSNFCLDSDPVFVSSSTLEDAVGYFKSSDTESGDNFGSAVDISEDGTRMVVGVPARDRVNSSNQVRPNVGAAYLFEKTATGWVEQAYLISSPLVADTNTLFGTSVSISDDGSTIAVGAQFDLSSGSGILNGSGVHGGKGNSKEGAVYIYTAPNWTQQAVIKASNADAFDVFGSVVDLSADGNTLVVGAPNEASDATGVSATPTGAEAGSGRGAVYAFVRSSNGTWVDQAYIKSPETAANDRFGTSVSLSDDGNTLAVGATRNSNGKVYLYTRQPSWTFDEAITPTYSGGATNLDTAFGSALSLSGDGQTLAVGDYLDDYVQTGILQGGSAQPQGGTIANLKSGAVYLFAENAGSWQQQAYLKTERSLADTEFGRSVSLSDDGQWLAVGSLLDTGGTGLADEFNSTQSDNSGGVFLFRNLNGISRAADSRVIKASNSAQSITFSGNAGSTVLSGDAQTLAVGARFEQSAATGIDGNQNDTSALSAGAVYLY